MKVKNFFIAVFFFSTVALNAQDLSFKYFDKDGDSLVEKQEFRNVFIEKYQRDLDNVDDRGLDDEDFYTISYNVLDLNNDNIIDPSEWENGYRYYYNKYLINDLSLYDINKDNYLSYTEYLDALTDTDYFITWDIDRNTFLSEDELAEQVFETWDLNGNEVLSKTEFRKFNSFYKD